MEGQHSWQEIVRSSSTLQEVRSKAGVYFQERGTGKGSGYKQYQRWFQNMQYQVNADGVLKNISALRVQALKSRDKNFSNSERSTSGDWTNQGPFDVYGGDAFSGPGLGRVNCMAFHPTDVNTFFAGTPAGGLWKTENNGTDWTPMTDGLPSIGISEIIIDPTNAAIMYILTGDGMSDDTPSIGVLKSTDGGLSWEETSLSFLESDTKVGYRMIMSPNSTNEFLVGLSVGGIMRTTNGFISHDTVLSTVTVWDLEYAPGNANIVYAATSNGIYRSDDGGQSWASNAISGLPSLPFPNERIAIATSPSNPSTVYAVFGEETSSGTFQGVYKSEDFGLNFELKGNSPNILASNMGGTGSANQAWYDLCILVHPENDATVFVGGVNMWKSNDNGTTWSRETWWTKNYEPIDPYVHADWHNMYYHNDQLYSCNDGGIARSADEGNDWADISKNLCLMQFYKIDLIEDKYMGGSQDNGINGGPYSSTTAQNILGGDGFGCAYHYGNTSIQYISNQERIARRQAGSNVFIWEESNSFWFTDIQMHKTNPAFIFITKNNELYRGSENTVFDYTWEDMGVDAYLPLYGHSSGQEIMGYTQNESITNVMYLLGTTNVILKTTNLSSNFPSWTQIADPTNPGAVLSHIAQDKNDQNKVWLSCSGYLATDKVWYSDDGGSEWENITDNLPNVPVRCILHESGMTYIGTAIGVYYRHSSMDQWAYFGNGLPNVPVNDLKIHGGYIYAGTFGRGLWRSPLASPCPYSLTLTQANDPKLPGKEEIYVENNLSSSRITEQSLGKEVLYSTENHLTLLPGFWAKGGSKLISMVGDCPY